MAKSKQKGSDLKKIFDELEKMSEWFSGEDIDLDVALEYFKKGSGLIKEARSQLKEMENEFKKVAKEEELP